MRGFRSVRHEGVKNLDGSDSSETTSEDGLKGNGDQFIKGTITAPEVPAGMYKDPMIAGAQPLPTQ